MRLAAWWRPAVIAVSTNAMLVAVTAGGQSTVRSLLVVWFLLVCPGLALAGLIPLPDPWVEIAVWVALSLALDIIVASTLGYAGAWSWSAAVAILVGISIAGAVAQVALELRRARSRRAEG